MKSRLTATTPCQVVCIDGWTSTSDQTDRIFAKTFLAENQGLGLASSSSTLSHNRREAELQVISQIRKQINSRLERYLNRSVWTRPSQARATLPLRSLGIAAEALKTMGPELKDKLLKLGQKTIRAGFQSIIPWPSDSKRIKPATAVTTALTTPVGLFVTVPILDYWQKQWTLMPLSLMAILLPGQSGSTEAGSDKGVNLFSSVIISLWAGKPLFLGNVMRRLAHAGQSKWWKVLLKGFLLDIPRAVSREDSLSQGFSVSYEKLSSSASAEALGGILTWGQLQKIWDEWTDLYGGSVLDGNLGASLLPVHVPKPWGREIWYTGIEIRGVAQAKGLVAGISTPSSDQSGKNQRVRANPQVAMPPALPLSSIMQTAFLLKPIVRFFKRSVAHNPILLKVLDPFPNRDYGDLYFELHQQKHEVYAISRIHSEAHSNGTGLKPGLGAIRMGFNPKKRREYKSFAAFKADFLKAIMDYRKVRLKIDARFDTIRKGLGIGLTTEVLPEVLAKWMLQIPKALRLQENRLRKNMEQFSLLIPLEVGDIVRIVPGVPHSLQHGVRAVEFQTPVYERLIISFNQKTLTQQHWDTKAAFKVLDETVIADAVRATERSLQPLTEESPTTRSLIANFNDFKVYRYILTSEEVRTETCGGDYLLLYVLKGTVRLVLESPFIVMEGRLQVKKTRPVTYILKKEQAFYVFPGAKCISLENTRAKGNSIYLKAIPKK